MKELLTKIFQMLGLDVPEDRSLSNAIGTITARLNELARREPADEILPARIAEAAGLPAGATADDLVAWVDETKNQIAAKGEEFAALRVTDCIKAGLGSGKIDPREAVFLFKSAARIGFRYSLGAINGFINDHEMIARRQLRSSAQKPAASIDPEQALINAQVGVSPEIFLKYSRNGHGH